MPRNRLVLLGASNLSRAFPIVVNTALSSFERPISILSAMGNGRSYGKESRFIEKKYLGIFFSGIWDEIKNDFQTPTTAFLTDIGNDLAYEVSVETILGWVETCLDRLDSVSAKVVLSDLPMNVLRDVSESRYRLFRSVFYPHCRLRWAEILTRAEQLSERLHSLANSRNIPIFIGRTEWHRFDPIHPRKAFLHQQWQELFALAGVQSNEHAVDESPRLLTWYLRCLRPESWSQFSIARRAQQPNGRLHDGTTIALY